MGWLEILSTIFTVVCVLLANYRSTWQYPVGIIGTILFFFAVFNQHLYANAGLQVFFTGVQVYGWWYWLRGGINRTKPKITNFGSRKTLIALSATLFASLIGGAVLNHFTNAAMASVDATVFGLSVFAQFLLDRKKIENWIIWAMVNFASVYLYYGAGLYVFAVLYAALFVNCFIAYRMWHNEQQLLDDTTQPGAAGELAATTGA